MPRNSVINTPRPSIKYSRSKFPLDYRHKTTFNLGDLVPFHLQEIYPGDTFKVNTDFALRTISPFIRVPMENLIIHMWYFFVPNRLTYSRWSEVMGENKNGPWAPPTLPEVPKVYGNETEFNSLEDKLKVSRSLMNYFGITPFSPQMEYSDLPFRGYALIWNEYFRNQNVQQPINVNIDDNPENVFLNFDAWSPDNYHGQVARVNKYLDYYTSCQPEPQKGPSINIPFGMVPVVTGQDMLEDNLDGLGAMKFYDPLGDITQPDYILGAVNGSLRGQESNMTGFVGSLVPSNLYASSTFNEGDIGNINDLRFAFQLQKMLERDAIYGTRYIEYVYGHFGVQNPDSRVQRPEYLSGMSMPLSMQQVTQTSQSSESSPLGQISAYSLTNGSAGFKKAFTEHGFVFGLMTVRQNHTYQQGLDRSLCRFKRTDYYDPLFATLPHQPVYLSELNTGSVDTYNEVVFGYNEAWADLRWRNNKITGFINSTLDTGFDIWHFGDYYEENAPIVISSEFVEETNEYLDRCLSVPSSTCPNFVIDIMNRQDAIRVMPVYSIPSLVDHH